MESNTPRIVAWTLVIAGAALSSVAAQSPAAPPLSTANDGEYLYVNGWSPAPRGLPRPVRISLHSDGQEPSFESHSPSISANGRFVAFVSQAPFAAADTNGLSDVYVHDRETGLLQLVSVPLRGSAANGSVEGQTGISRQGRFVAFGSQADDLVTGDTNGKRDVFVRDRLLQTTWRASVHSSGAQGTELCTLSSLSADGRYASFLSRAPELVDGDTNGVDDVFVHDAFTSTTVRVNVGVGGQANGASSGGALSADGGVVAFVSVADNLVVGDSGGFWDVFVRDLVAGTTELVSATPGGAHGNGHSATPPAISRTGRWIAFASHASDLVAGDNNGRSDVFVHDRVTGITERVSVDSWGVEGNDGSHSPSLSANGRYVGFASIASNLVVPDGNLCDDAFVHDRATGITVPLTTNGAERVANNFSSPPRISANGRHAAFASFASDLVLGDGNGAKDVFQRPLPWSGVDAADLVQP